MAPPEARTIVSSHPDKVRMLVLETDETHPQTQKEKGSFGNVFNELFLRAGEEHEPKLGIETMMQYVVEDDGGKVPDREYITEEIHAILITGSMYDAHGDEDWILKLLDLIRYLWVNRPDIKFAGVCFGHQILCRALGAEVRPSPGGDWELSHTAMRLDDTGRALFNLPPDEEHIYLHQMHLDHVVAPPSPETTNLLDSNVNVHVWATSEHTGVQGVYIRKRLFTTQGHMEFDDKMVKRQLEMRVKSGAITEGEADEAKERAEWMHDGLMVAKAVLRFFHGEDDEVR